MSTARLFLALADTMADLLDSAAQLDGAEVHDGRARHVIDRIRLDGGKIDAAMADRLVVMLTTGTGKPTITAVEDPVADDKHNADTCDECEAATEAKECLEGLPELLKEAREHFDQLVSLAPYAADPVTLSRIAEAAGYKSERWSAGDLIAHIKRMAAAVEVKP